MSGNNENNGGGRGGRGGPPGGGGISMSLSDLLAGLRAHGDVPDGLDEDALRVILQQMAENGDLPAEVDFEGLPEALRGRGRRGRKEQVISGFAIDQLTEQIEGASVGAQGFDANIKVRSHVRLLVKKGPADVGDVGVVQGKVEGKDDMIEVKFPKQHGYAAKAGDVELCTVSNPIRPGSRVKIRDSITEPRKHWGYLTDKKHDAIGIVHSITSTGDVKIHFGERRSFVGGGLAGIRDCSSWISHWH